MLVSSPNWRRWAWIAISVHFLLIFSIGLSHYWGYLLNDLSVFDQTVWGTLNGNFFLNTINNPFGKPINWLGFHFNPILLLFAPLYAIVPAPEWLTLAQAIALSLAAWPVFQVASRVCQSEQAGLLWALAYLANPFQLNAAAWDFHPVTLAAPFITLGMLAVEKADRRMLLFSCVPLLLIQEHLGLTVAGFGLLWRLRNHNWNPATALILVGLTHSILVLAIVMPALSPTNQHLMLGSELGQLSRYGWLGHSIQELVWTLLTQPFEVTKIIALDLGGATYLAGLLLPLLGLPLAAPGFLLPGVADLAANLFSANPMPKSIFSYHSATLATVFTVAAIYGSQRLSRRTRKFSMTEWAGLALVGCFVAGYFLAPAPLPMARNHWQPTHHVYWPDPAPERINAMIGNNATVSAQANVAAHFSQRRELYFYPNHVGKADVILLRLESPTVKLSPSNLSVISTLAFHLQMNPADYLSSVDCLLSGNEYGVLFWDNPWLVMSRNASPHPALRQEIKARVKVLQKQWQVERNYTSILDRQKECGSHTAVSSE